jgi:hypothetical protein
MGPTPVRDPAYLVRKVGRLIRSTIGSGHDGLPNCLQDGGLLSVTTSLRQSRADNTSSAVVVSGRSLSVEVATSAK